MLACDKIFARLTLKCFNLYNNTLTKFVVSVSNRYLNQRQTTNKCSLLRVKNFYILKPKYASSSSSSAKETLILRP